VHECARSSVEKLELFKEISLSQNKITIRVENIGNTIQLQNKARELKYFLSALDMSTDITDNTQLQIIIRSIFDLFNSIKAFDAKLKLLIYDCTLQHSIITVISVILITAKYLRTKLNHYVQQIENR